MVGTPRLGAAFGNAVALRNLVKALEDDLAGNMSLILRENLLAEVLLKVLADNPYNLAEASLDSIVDAVVHDRLTIGTQSVKLFQTTVTAAHAGS